MLFRTLSILVLAPLLLAALIKGSALVFLIILLFTQLGLLNEWQGFKGNSGSRVGFLLSLGVAVTALLLSYFEQGQFLPMVIMAGVGFLFVWRMVGYRAGVSVLPVVGFELTGLIYCALPLYLLMQVRLMPGGEWYLIFLLAMMWSTDIGAYIFGKLLGKAKLAPHISPGKTQAGGIGGLIMAPLTAGVLVWLLPIDLPLFHAVGLAVVLSLVGQLGDLLESLLKREAGIKDSGQLIPGHGGLLDRLDSLLLATPVFFLYLYGLKLLVS